MSFPVYIRQESSASASTATQSQLIQIYSVDWTDVYDTHNIEHRTEPVSH